MEESHQLNIYEYLDLSATYMFLIKRRLKLEDKIIQGIFLRYSTQSKGYRVQPIKKSLSLVEMLKLMKMLLGIMKKKKLLKATH